VVLLAGEVSRPQGGELALVGKEGVESAGDDHVEVDVELAAGDVHVKERNLAPPPLPPLLQLLYPDFRVQPSAVVREAVEGDPPGGVFGDAGVELIDVFGVIPGSPLDSQDGNMPVLFRGLVAFAFPGSDVDGGEARVFRPAVLACMLDNLLPGVFNGLLFLS
jgi:hypothetical protein